MFADVKVDSAASPAACAGRGSRPGCLQTHRGREVQPHSMPPGQSRRAAMWRNNDASSRLRVPAAGQVRDDGGAVALALASQGYSSLLEGLCRIMQPRVAHRASGQLAVQAACRGRREGLAYRPKKKKKKKAPSFVWLNMDGLEAQAEGGGGENAQIEFRFTQRLPPFCGVTQRPPFSTSTLGSASVRTSELAFRAFPVPSERVRGRCYGSSEC